MDYSEWNYFTLEINDLLYINADTSNVGNKLTERTLVLVTKTQKAENMTNSGLVESDEVFSYKAPRLRTNRGPYVIITRENTILGSPI
jgi:hypothetical protein